MPVTNRRSSFRVPAASRVFLGGTVLAAGAAFAASALASPPPGILAHWNFDQIGSGIATESVAGMNGTLLGGAAMVAGGASGGALDGALKLSIATGSVADMGNILPLTGNTPCTIVAWVKLAAGTPGFQAAVSRHVSGTLNGYFIGTGNTACYGAVNRAWSYRSNTCGTEVISVSSVVDGQWHMVAMTYHPNTGTRVYVDAGPPETISGGSAVIANAGRFLVGGYMVGASPTAGFEGFVDDVQVYGRALTCWEVNMLFNTPGIESQFEVDLNGDGIVDGADLGLLLANWGTPACDLNGDGIVDGGDLGVMLGNWGSC